MGCLSWVDLENKKTPNTSCWCWCLCPPYLPRSTLRTSSNHCPSLGCKAKFGPPGRVKVLHKDLLYIWLVLWHDSALYRKGQSCSPTARPVMASGATKVLSEFVGSPRCFPMAYVSRSHLLRQLYHRAPYEAALPGTRALACC